MRGMGKTLAKDELVVVGNANICASDERHLTLRPMDPLLCDNVQYIHNRLLRSTSP